MAGAGYKLFTAGETLEAAEVNTYLNEQSVMVFATAAARDTALSAAKAHGMVAYLKDTPRRLTYYDGTNWQFLTSEWTTWVPSYTNITAGSGTTTTAWAYTGFRTVTATWRFVFGAGSAIGTGPSLTLPVAPSTSLEVEATRVTMQDSSGARYYGALTSGGGSNVTIVFEQVSGTAIIAATVTASLPFVWAGGDYLIFTITYGI